MARWKNYFSQLLNVHGVDGVRQAEMHTAEPLVAQPSAFEFELANEKLRWFNILPPILQISLWSAAYSKE